MRIRCLCFVLGMIFLLGVFAGGCADKTPAPDGDILRVAIGSDINTWGVDRFPDGDARYVWAQIYETLVRLDEDLSLVPGLALSWEPEQDGKVWLFHLREDVLFHDGSPFDAASVLHSYGGCGYVFKSGILPLEKVEAVDDHTVRFICTKPTPLPTYLTHVAWPVVSPTSVDADGDFIQPVGTGPFKFVRHTKGQEVVLERNEDYWGGAEKLARVIFKIIPDTATRIMALTAGEVDMSVKIPETEVERLAQNPDIALHRKVTTFTDFMHFNCARAPFDDVQVRRAVAHALDTEGLTKNILHDIGRTAGGRAWAPGMMYSCPDLPLYSQDLAQARAALDAAGWVDVNGDGLREKNGRPLEISIIVSTSWNPRQMKMAEACQAQLGEVGFAVNILQTESAAAEDLEMQGQFDIVMRTGHLVWGPYPHHARLHHSEHYRSHYHNPAYDELVEKGERELDEQAKQAIYADIQKMILDELPAFYLVHEEKIVATRKNVQGYRITAEDPWLELKGITLAE